MIFGTDRIMDIDNRDQTRLDTATAARLIKLTPQRVRQLDHEGFIKRISPTRYALIDVVHGRIDSLLDQIKNKTQSHAQSELSNERTLQLRQRRAIEAGSLISFEETQALFEEMIGVLRVGLAGLPANLTRDLNERQRIETYTDRILADIALRFDQSARNIEAAAGSVRAAKASNPAPVGKRKRRLSADQRKTGPSRTKPHSLRDRSRARGGVGPVQANSDGDGSAIGKKLGDT